MADETDNYRLTGGTFVEGTSGITDLELSWTRKDQEEFTTRDRDNDSKTDGNCAMILQGAGWYRSCTFIHLNAAYGAEGESGSQQMYWEQFKAKNALKSIDLSIKRNE